MWDNNVSNVSMKKKGQYRKFTLKNFILRYILLQISFYLKKEF